MFNNKFPIGSLFPGKSTLHLVAQLVVHHDLPDDVDGQAPPEVGALGEHLQVLAAQLDNPKKLKRFRN